MLIDAWILEYSHTLILLAGFAVAVLSLVGAIAVGPYGRRGVRPFLAVVSVAAFAGSGFYLVTYLGLIEQRRGIETRLAALRAQAVSTPALACLERAGEIVENACAQTLFSAADTLAAANVYTAARFDVLMAAARYTGPRTGQFDDAVGALEHSLRQDPFGLTANVLVLREGCTAQRCEAMAVFNDPTRLWSNIRQKTFEANAQRYAAGWRAPGSAPTPAASGPGILAPTGTETRAPIPDRYTLPSSDSIPPVSIMNDEPQRRETPPPAAAQRPAPAAPVQAEAEQPTVTAPAAAQPKRTRPAAQKQQQRRETTRPSGPMSISPKQ